MLVLCVGAMLKTNDTQVHNQSTVNISVTSVSIRKGTPLRRKDKRGPNVTLTLTAAQQQAKVNTSETGSQSNEWSKNNTLCLQKCQGR